MNTEFRAQGHEGAFSGALPPRGTGAFPYIGNAPSDALPTPTEGHREQQERTANPSLQWLREIILAASPGDIGREMNTGQFLRIAEDAGIEFPGNPNSKDDPAIRAGRILGKLFRDTEGKNIPVDGFVFTRIEAPDYSPTGGGEVRKFYTIENA